MSDLQIGDSVFFKWDAEWPHESWMRCLNNKTGKIIEIERRLKVYKIAFLTGERVWCKLTSLALVNRSLSLTVRRKAT